MLELNKSNFDKEIKNNKLIIIDAWAEWCVESNSTWILTEDNLVKSAKNVSEKDKLLTYNGKEIVSDYVKRSFTSNMLGHCREIWTETNRRIKVTDEHEFLTPQGWKQARKLKEGDNVAVMPNYTMSEDIFTIEEKTIITEKEILKAIPISMSKKRFKDYITELKEKELLPLKLNNKKLLILTRIMGSLFTDGNLYLCKKNNYREISFFFGTKQDIESIKTDLSRLGFNKTSVREEKRKIEVNGRSYIINSKRVKVCSTSLWLLMKALGAPIGDKTNLDYAIPTWLMKTNCYYLKKEFLSAFMGGDGPKISISLVKGGKKQPYNHLNINDLEFHKNPEALESGLKLAGQLSKLFRAANVKINKIFVENDNYIKKDGKKSKIIHLVFKKDFENGFNLYQNIGYRYAYTKDMESKYSSEFLRRILNKRKNWINKYYQAIKLHKEKGFESKKISEILSIDVSTVFSWIKNGKKPSINKHYTKYPQWLMKNTKNLPKGLVWESIKAAREVYLESVQKISMKTNHNFIANGFLAHNCGPCKAMSPIFEELSKELKNVKFAKLNVDEHTDIASKYNVMSIPTFLIFKGGKEVGRIIGGNPKSVLKSKIESAIK